MAGRAKVLACLCSYESTTVKLMCYIPYTGFPIGMFVYTPHTFVRGVHTHRQQACNTGHLQNLS